MSETKSRTRVMMLETGGWGGIHSYAHALCNALVDEPLDLVLLTNEKYELADRPGRFRRLQVLKRESYLRTLAKVGRLLVREKTDILHVQSLISQRKDLILLLLCRLLHIRLVLTVHNILPHEVRPFERVLYFLYYRLADALIVHSRANGDRLLEQVPDLDGQKIRVIAHGNYAEFGDLELEREAAREKLGLPQHRPIALFFGAIRPYKRLDLFLQLVKPVREACQEAFFAVAGNVLKGDQADYERQIADLELGGEDLHVRFDYLSMADSIAYVCAADLLVLPYREIYQSGVLLFAFSFGRPVLATRVGSFPETIHEGKCGWLVERDDVAGLRAAAIRLLRERKELAAAGDYARRLATEQYHWQGIARRTSQVYEKVERQI